MFKKSRVKIVAFVMSALILFVFGTVIIILGSSYYEISERTHEMINEYVRAYSLNKPSDEKKPTEDIPPKKSRQPDNGNLFLRERVECYSAAFSAAGDVLKVETGHSNNYTENDIIAVSEKILAQNKLYGRIENVVFVVAYKENYSLVAFTENTVLYESFATLFRFTLLYGIFAIIVFFAISVLFSKWIVRPLEENYNKQKQFISDAGHELKTPISVISANAEILERELGENIWLSNIQYENERMGLLIKQLLELSKTEASAAPMEEIDLSRIVLGEALPFESVAFENDHELKCDIQENLHIMGNTSQIKQLTAILLDNAVSHSNPQKEIVLNLKEKHKNAALTVINYGHEISKEQQSEIFERFYRMDKVRSSHENHYGLGLAIAKAIVTSHKGKMEVKCYDGKVEFTVFFPLS